MSVGQYSLDGDGESMCCQNQSHVRVQLGRGRNLEVSMIGLLNIVDMKHGDVVSFRMLDLASVRLLRY